MLRRCWGCPAARQPNKAGAGTCYCGAAIRYFHGRDNFWLASARRDLTLVYAQMADSDLEAIRQARKQELQSQQGGDKGRGGGGQADEQKYAAGSHISPKLRRRLTLS